MWFQLLRNVSAGWRGLLEVSRLPEQTKVHTRLRNQELVQYEQQGIAL